MVIIKWTNKYSNETGYVASISTKNECFINTFEQSEAKRYSEKSVKGMLTKLESFHETDDNDFEVITVEE
jgi:ribosomal protein L13